MKLPKTRLRWSRHRDGIPSLYYTAHIKEGRKTLFDLYVWFDPTAKGVTVERSVWLHDSEHIVLMDEKRYKDVTIDWFIREFKGLEANLLSDLQARLQEQAKIVGELIWS